MEVDWNEDSDIINGQTFGCRGRQTDRQYMGIKDKKRGRQIYYETVSVTFVSVCAHACGCVCVCLVASNSKQNI